MITLYRQVAQFDGITEYLLNSDFKSFGQNPLLVDFHEFIVVAVKSPWCNDSQCPWHFHCEVVSVRKKERNEVKGVVGMHMCVANGIDLAVIHTEISHSPERSRSSIQQDLVFVHLYEIAAVSPFRNGNQSTGAEDGEMHQYPRSVSTALRRTNGRDLMRLIISKSTHHPTNKKPRYWANIHPSVYEPHSAFSILS